MSNGLATTGVDGPEVIIAEARGFLLVQLLSGKWSGNQPWWLSGED